MLKKTGGFLMNSRRTFIRNSVLASGAIASGIFPKELFASGDLIRLTVMHTNDIHCHIDPFPEDHAEFPGKGGLVRIASVVNHYRKKNPNLLLFDAGDMFQGTPYFNYFKGDLIVKLMNQIGYQAGTIGNHEFDNGLGDILSAAQKAEFPLISSNYDFSNTILNGHVKTHHILKMYGLKVGIYGLGIELSGLVNKPNYADTRYLDPLETALKMEKMLKLEHNCDLVICLSHLGFSYEHSKISDKSLAPNTHFTDLIIGGHTHSFLEKPVVVNNAVGKPIIINQAGWAALSVGKIEFIFDRTSKKKEPIILVNNL